MFFLLMLVCPFANPGDRPVPSPLRIGTSASYAPLTFKVNGTFQGVEADLAKAISEILNVKTRVVEMPVEELIPALNDNKIDVIMSGMSVTSERSKLVLFTKPYMKIGQMALIRTADRAQLSRPDALLVKDTKIGVKSGTTGEDFAKAKLPDAVITSFATIDEGIDALGAKDIDIFIHDAPTIWRLLSGNPAMTEARLVGLYRPLTDEYLAWAVRLRDDGLANALNQSLDKMKSDGTLGRIMGKWIPMQVTKYIMWFLSNRDNHLNTTYRKLRGGFYDWLNYKQCVLGLSHRHETLPTHPTSKQSDVYIITDCLLVHRNRSCSPLPAERIGAGVNGGGKCGYQYTTEWR